MKKLVFKPIVICLLVLMVSALTVISYVKIKTTYSKNDSASAAQTIYIANATDWENFREKTNLDGSLNAKLTADIDFGGSKIAPLCSYATFSTYDYEAYSGTFDGDGHTLSNFVIDGTWDYAWGTNGLFGYTYHAKIKNLRIKNGVYKAHGSSENKSLCIGGLVAVDWEKTTISNCFLDNISLSTTTSWSQYGSIGGIVGLTYMGGGTIQDCYVKNLKINCPFIARHISGNNRVYVGGVSYNYDKNITIHRCVFDPTFFEMEVVCYSNYGSMTEKKRMTYKNGTLSGNDTSVSNTVGAYTLFEYIGKGATNSFSSSVTQTGRAWSNVCSNKGGANASDSYGKVYTWYFNTAYNNSYPILRQFVAGWKDYIFTSTNTTVAKISGSNASITITVPSDYSDSNVHLKSGDNSMYVVEGVNNGIYVTVTNDNYEFVGWSGSGNVKTAQIELALFQINFNLADYISTTGLEYTQVFEIRKADNSLTISVSDLQIQISFNDKNGTARTIVYTISDNRYCIDKLQILDNLNNLKQEVKSSTSYNVAENVKISVFAKLKEYSVVFE